MKTILFYNDSRVFGGHEIMSAEMANSLSARYRVHFLYSHKKFNGLLMPEVNQIKVTVSSPVSFAGIRSFNPFQISYLMKLMRNLAPDLSIICQGSIEYCYKGVLASKKARLKTVSYLPMAFSFREMGIALGRARDAFNKYLYNSPDAFITVSGEQKALIEKNLVTKKDVFVLKNFIDSDISDGSAKRSSDGKLRAGLIGGVKFKTKGQDRAVSIAAELKSMKIDFVINVIGDGRDREKLMGIVREHGLDNNFVFRGWLNDKKEIYSDLDIVLITSNFEAFPLTLLESLLFNKVVFAPDQGIFREYLNSDFLFKDEKDAARKISGFLSGREEAYDNISGIRNRIITDLSRENFETGLCRIVDGLYHKHKSH